MLDSFGLGPRTTIAGRFTELPTPKVNMCFPPLEWQTYDIDFTAAKYEGDKKMADAAITVRQNGVLVRQDQDSASHEGRPPASKTPSPARCTCRTTATRSASRIFGLSKRSRRGVSPRFCAR